MSDHESRPRTIIHLDLDAFFCAVEEQANPSLRGKPFAVGARASQRGVVASCSYPARKYGVRSAMPMAQAQRLCPGLIVVPRSHGDYSAASRKVMRLLRGITPLVEQLSIDEAFLDLSERDIPGETLARHIQARIRGELGLPCSLGVASNKLVAKIANSVGKANAATDDYPYAITVVPPGEEAAFLAPLPTRELWGVGPKTAESLAALGIHTIGDIAAYPAQALAERFGKHGADLSRRARGLDHRPIVTERTPKSLSRETTFHRDTADTQELRETLTALALSVGKRLRRKRLHATTVKIKLRWSDFTTLTRQVTLPAPTDTDDAIISAALHLLAEHRPQGRAVRLIGVGVSGFSDAPQQLSLWDAAPANADASPLEDTLSALRERFGDDVIRPAADVE